MSDKFGCVVLACMHLCIFAAAKYPPATIPPCTRLEILYAPCIDLCTNTECTKRWTLLVDACCASSRQENACRADPQCPGCAVLARLHSACVPDPPESSRSNEDTAHTSCCTHQRSIISFIYGRRMSTGSYCDGHRPTACIAIERCMRGSSTGFHLSPPSRWYACLACFSGWRWMCAVFCRAHCAIARPCNAARPRNAVAALRCAWLSARSLCPPAAAACMCAVAAPVSSGAAGVSPRGVGGPWHGPRRGGVVSPGPPANPLPQEALAACCALVYAPV